MSVSDCCWCVDRRTACHHSAADSTVDNTNDDTNNNTGDISTLNDTTINNSSTTDPNNIADSNFVNIGNKNNSADCTDFGNNSANIANPAVLSSQAVTSVCCVTTENNPNITDNSKLSTHCEIFESAAEANVCVNIDVCIEDLPSLSKDSLVPIKPVTPDDISCEIGTCPEDSDANKEKQTSPQVTVAYDYELIIDPKCCLSSEVCTFESREEFPSHDRSLLNSAAPTQELKFVEENLFLAILDNQLVRKEGNATILHSNKFVEPSDPINSHLLELVYKESNSLGNLDHLENIYAKDEKSQAIENVIADETTEYLLNDSSFQNQTRTAINVVNTVGCSASVTPAGDFRNCVLLQNCESSAAASPAYLEDNVYLGLSKIWHCGSPESGTSSKSIISQEDLAIWDKKITDTFSAAKLYDAFAPKQPFSKRAVRNLFQNLLTNVADNSATSFSLELSPPVLSEISRLATNYSLQLQSCTDKQIASTVALFNRGTKQASPDSTTVALCSSLGVCLGPDHSSGSPDTRKLLSLDTKYRHPGTEDYPLVFEAELGSKTCFEERVALGLTSLGSTGGHHGMEKSDQMPSLVCNNVASQGYIFGDIAPILSETQHHFFPHENTLNDINSSDQMKLQRIFNDHSINMTNESIPSGKMNIESEKSLPCNYFSSAIPFTSSNAVYPSINTVPDGTLSSLFPIVDNSFLNQPIITSQSEILGSSACPASHVNQTETSLIRQQKQQSVLLTREEPFDSSYIGDNCSRENSEDREDYNTLLADDDGREARSLLRSVGNNSDGLLPGVFAQCLGNNLISSEHLNGPHLPSVQPDINTATVNESPITKYIEDHMRHSLQQRECFHYHQQLGALDNILHKENVLTHNLVEQACDSDPEKMIALQPLQMNQHHINTEEAAPSYSGILLETDPIKNGSCVNQCFDEMLGEYNSSTGKSSQHFTEQNFHQFLNSFNQQDLHRDDHSQFQPKIDQPVQNLPRTTTNEVADGIGNFLLTGFNNLDQVAVPLLSDIQLFDTPMECMSKHSKDSQNIWADLNANSLTSSVSSAFGSNANQVDESPGQEQAEQYLCKTFQSLGLERIWGSNNLGPVDDEYGRIRQQMLQAGHIQQLAGNIDRQQMDMWAPMVQQTTGSSGFNSTNAPFLCLSSEQSDISKNTSPLIDSSSTGSTSSAQLQHQLPIMQSVTGSNVAVSSNPLAELINTFVPAAEGPSGVQAVLQHTTQSNFSSVVPKRTSGSDVNKPPVNKDTLNAVEENLLTSPRTHFRPIKSHDATTTAIATLTTLTDANSLAELSLPYQRSNSGNLFLEKDDIDGSPKKYMIYKDPLDKSQEHRPLYMTNQETSLIPKFKVIKNEKFCQTDHPVCVEPRLEANEESTCATLTPESDEDFDVFSFQKHDIPTADVDPSWAGNLWKEPNNAWESEGNLRFDPNIALPWPTSADDVIAHVLPSEDSYCKILPCESNKSVASKETWTYSKPSSPRSSQINVPDESITPKPTNSYANIGNRWKGGHCSRGERIIDTPAARAIWSSDPSTSVTVTGQHYHQAILAPQHIDPAIKALWANSSDEKITQNIPSTAFVAKKRNNNNNNDDNDDTAVPAWTMKGSRNAGRIQQQIPGEWLNEQSVLCSFEQESSNSCYKSDPDNVSTLPCGTDYLSHDDTWSSGDDCDPRERDDDAYYGGHVQWSDGTEVGDGNSGNGGETWWSNLALASSGKNEQYLEDLAALAEAQNWEKNVQ